MGGVFRTFHDSEMLRVTASSYVAHMMYIDARRVFSVAHLEYRSVKQLSLVVVFSAVSLRVPHGTIWV